MRGRYIFARPGFWSSFDEVETTPQTPKALRELEIFDQVFLELELDH
jgi:hypothetical protein